MIYVLTTVSILCMVLLAVLLRKNNEEAEEVSARLEDQRQENDRLRRRIMGLEREVRDLQMSDLAPVRSTSPARQMPPAEPPARITQPRSYRSRVETQHTRGAVPNVSLGATHGRSTPDGIVLGMVASKILHHSNDSDSQQDSGSCRDSSFSSSSTDYGGSCGSSSSSSDSGSCSCD